MIKNRGQSYQLGIGEAGSGCVGYIETAREQPSWWPDHTSIYYSITCGNRKLETG